MSNESKKIYSNEEKIKFFESQLVAIELAIKIIENRRQWVKGKLEELKK